MRTRLAFGIVMMLASIVRADPALPAAMRAKVEQRGAIQAPIIYLAPTAKAPARWMVFVGTPAAPALSAWLVAPGAGDKNEIAAVGAWPNALRVLGATQGLLPASVPGNPGEPNVFLLVESLAAPELGQPAGLRSILAIGIPEPQYVASTSAYVELVPFVAGVKDASEQGARFEAAARFWDEDTTDKLLLDDKRLLKLVATAKKSDKVLAKLIPSGGIAVDEAWQLLFARETGRITKLDKSPEVKALRAALANVDSCQGHVCGELLLGAENGKLAIRALVGTPAVPAARVARRAVTASAKDTQTMATAAAIAVTGKFRAEAPLGPPGATIGVVDGTVIVRDGGYVATHELWEDGSELRFGDFDGDGLTDVMSWKTSAQFAMANRRGLADTPSLELATVGTTTADAAAAAALALPDDPVTKKQACAVLAKVTSAKSLASVLAPGALVYGYGEPGQPSRLPLEPMTGKDAAQALKGKCPIEACDGRVPVCQSPTDGPSTDYFQLTRVNGAWKLVRVALYRGA